MIQKLIDDNLLKENETPRQRSGKFSPSSFGRCFRYQYWNRLNIPISDPLTPRVLGIFKAGKLFHDYVESLLPLHEHEVKIETEDILGFADLVLDDLVIDIKTVHPNDLMRMSKPNYNVVEDKFTNILQVMSYVYLLKKNYGELIFVSRANLLSEEFKFKIEDWVFNVEHELEMLRDYWNKQELPPPLPRVYGGKECSYCSFRTKCKGGNCEIKE